MTPQELTFDAFLKSLPRPLGDIFRGRLEISKFEVQELASAFNGIKQEINARWRTHSTFIKAPHGPVDLHMDYIDSTVLNAITFGANGTHFVGITDKMLVHFSKIAAVMWRLNTLADLLEIEMSQEVRNFLFHAVLLIQLQFISSHELGHLFHGHIDRTALHQEFASGAPHQVPPVEKLRDQAHEVEADGYAVHMLLDNLIVGDSGPRIYERLGSRLSADHCILTLFLLSVGSLFFFLAPQEFDVKNVRRVDHPFPLARMNVVMYDLTGWCELKRSELRNWATLDKFQQIMGSVQQAADSPDQATAWRKQGDFLNSSEGKQYLGDLYAERETLRADMTSRRWELIRASGIK